MKYYLGPWIWRESVDDGNYWDAPVGTIARIDLRPLPCNIPGYGFFALEKPPKESGYVKLAESLTKSLSLSAKTALIDALNLSSLDAMNLRDVLAEILTTKADPAGAVRCLPLIPKVDGTLEIVLAGHSVVWDRKFEGEPDPAWPNIQKVLQENYRRIRALALLEGQVARVQDEKVDPQSLTGMARRLWREIYKLQQAQPALTWSQARELVATKHETLHRRVLDAWHEKYAISSDLFIPPDLPIESAQSHDSSVSDDFNRGNESLDVGNWTEIQGNQAVDTNQVLLFTAGRNTARYDTALSSDDHQADVDYVSRIGNNRVLGAACRVASGGAITYYSHRGSDSASTWALHKWVTDTPTQLDSGAWTPSLPDTFRVSANGSTIRGFINAVEVSSNTDSIISGNLYTGISGFNDAMRGDNFAAEDLSVSAFVPRITIF